MTPAILILICPSGSGGWCPGGREIFAALGMPGEGIAKLPPPPELTKMSQKKFALGMGEIVIFALGMHKKFIIEKTTFLAKFF
jgi:hypothetical protein